MGIETAIMAAVGIGSALLQKNSAKKSYQAQKEASQEMQAQNQALLDEQQAANTAAAVTAQEKTALENQATTSVTQVEAGGTADVSTEAGYSGSEIRRRKRNASTISTSLGL